MGEQKGDICRQKEYVKEIIVVRVDIYTRLAYLFFLVYSSPSYFLTIPIYVLCIFTLFFFLSKICILIKPIYLYQYLYIPIPPGTQAIRSAATSTKVSETRPGCGAHRWLSKGHGCVLLYDL